MCISWVLSHMFPFSVSSPLRKEGLGTRFAAATAPQLLADVPETWCLWRCLGPEARGRRACSEGATAPGESPFSRQQSQTPDGLPDVPLSWLCGSWPRQRPRPSSPTPGSPAKWRAGNQRGWVPLECCSRGPRLKGHKTLCARSAGPVCWSLLRGQIACECRVSVVVSLRSTLSLP